MGPIAVFDKSFLQSLSVDQSVWFDHFFTAIVSPVFYAETLADLAKGTLDRGRAEKLVRSIASKFPELSGGICANHSELCLSNLLGQQVPMNGQVPLPGGRPVKSGTRVGFVYDRSPESEALDRWRRGEFEEVERLFAHDWRRMFTTLDLQAVAESLRALNADGKRPRSLDEVKRTALDIVTREDKPYERLRLAVAFCNVPNEFHPKLVERWEHAAHPSLAIFAPYAAHVIAIEVFLQLALGAGLISSDRPSNRIDIAYLFYVPFSMIFISGDKLHQRCAPLFLRDDQRFVWGPNLKEDLRRINEHFLQLPEVQREAGIMQFARRPPDLEYLVIGEIRDRMMPQWRDRRESPPLSAEAERKLIEELNALKSAPTISVGEARPDDGALDFLSIKRAVHKRKGSWWQLPKDMKESLD